MLVSCWSAKGGSGTTVVAAALAVVARPGATTDGALLVDPPATCPPCSACPSPTARAHRVVGRRAAVPPTPSPGSRSPVRPGLRLLPTGSRAARRARPGRGAGRAARRRRPSGRGRRRGRGRRPERRPRRPRSPGCWPPRPPSRLLVHPSCYLSPARARSPAVAAVGRRAGRRAGPGARAGGTIEDVVGAPVVAEVPSTPVARAVDAGLLGRRLPRGPRAGAASCRLTASPADATSSTARRARCTGACSTAARPSSVGRASSGACCASLARDRDPLLLRPGVESVVDRVRARVDGLGPLEPLLADPAVTEVMVNGGGRGLGRARTAASSAPTGRRRRAHRRWHLIERIVAPLGLHVDRVQPARRRPAARRLAGATPSCGRSRSTGPCLTIRRFGARADARSAEVAQPGAAALLAWAVRARANVVVCGGAGAGKTTLLNALGGRDPRPTSGWSPSRTPPSCACPASHVVRLEARPASAEGAGEVRIRDLVRNALRMRPDRIVVGEVRAGEALDMLQAMNTGHEGSLSTCHANGPADALRRLETLVLMGDVGLPAGGGARAGRSAARPRRADRPRPDGGRRVVAVAEVEPVERGRRALRSPAHRADGRLVALPDRPARAADAPAPVRRAGSRRSMSAGAGGRASRWPWRSSRRGAPAGAGAGVAGVRTRRRARRRGRRAVGVVGRPTAARSGSAAVGGPPRSRGASTGGRWPRPVAGPTRPPGAARPGHRGSCGRGRRWPVAVAAAAVAVDDPGTLRLARRVGPGRRSSPARRRVAPARPHAGPRPRRRGAGAGGRGRRLGRRRCSTASATRLRDRRRPRPRGRGRCRRRPGLGARCMVRRPRWSSPCWPRCGRPSAWPAVLFGTPLGWACLVGGVLLDAVGRAAGWRAWSERSR